MTATILMLYRLINPMFAVLIASSGALQYGGHLCEVDGPVRGPDCCCGSEDDSGNKQAHRSSNVDLPSCCEGTVDIVSHLSASSAEQGAVKLASVLLTAGDLDLARSAVGAPSSKCPLRLRAPPDPRRVPLYLQHQTLLI